MEKTNTRAICISMHLANNRCLTVHLANNDNNYYKRTKRLDKNVKMHQHDALACFLLMMICSQKYDRVLKMNKID